MYWQSQEQLMADFMDYSFETQGCLHALYSGVGEDLESSLS